MASLQRVRRACECLEVDISCAKDTLCENPEVELYSAQIRGLRDLAVELRDARDLLVLELDGDESGGASANRRIT